MFYLHQELQIFEKFNYRANGKFFMTFELTQQLIEKCFFKNFYLI